jgi:AGCS family alanine or glycine:cation symporter
VNILDSIDSIFYYPILIIVLAAAGIYFTVRTRFIQGRHLIDCFSMVAEKPSDKSQVSSFQALMVSTASRVGTGNIIGVSTAICLGGPGAVFWMWILAIIGSSTAFAESTLAQIYKKRDHENERFYGGPAYYIETALHSKALAVVFAVFLILTYGFGFNMLCSYNMQSTLMIYDFYDAKTTPLIIGGILAVIVGICIMGGGKRIVHVTEVMVPFMGLIYVAATVIIIGAHVSFIPAMFKMIFSDAFNFRSIGSGIAGSCLVYGIKRGLYSNEAGVGSAPNAAASADVSHPAKQGFVQMLSVYIDTLLLCTATAFACLITGIIPSEKLSGAPYVQEAMSTVFRGFGPVFITICMIMFGFTTLIGNLYYVDNALAFLNHKKMPGKTFMRIFHIICAVIIFLGALAPMNVCWDLADITMGGMAVINIPSCLLLSGVVMRALRDFEKQKKLGKNPVFKARNAGIDEEEAECWK